MPKFRLANGDEFECTFCGLATVGILYIDLHGMSLAKALRLFSTADKVTHMEHDNGHGTIRAYDGYTVVVGVEHPGSDNNVVRVAMRRKYEGEVI